MEGGSEVRGLKAQSGPAVVHTSEAPIAKIDTGNEIHVVHTLSLVHV